MRLNSIKIKNYRSIDDTVEINFFKELDKNCYFLFGINETGKSNILKGCALLDNDFQEKYNWSKDCFKDNKSSSVITEVDYCFDFNDEELAYIQDTSTSNVPSELTKEITGFRYWIEGDIDSEIYYGCEVIFKDDAKFSEYFKKKEIKTEKPEEPKTENNGEVVDNNTNNAETSNEEKSRLLLLKSSEITEEEKDKYEEIEADKISSIVAELIEDNFVKKRLPKIIYWNSSSRYLINGTIDLNTFKDKPEEVSVPLLNMFKFLKYDKKQIKRQITEALKDATDRHKLASDLSKATTKHLNNVWKEHNVEVQVTIESNGSCDVHFTDKDANTNFFEMQDRSDGFQRFISFILTLSAENLNEELTNSLILLDEPEVHLHPSGIEYLKDELLNISRNNYVLAASHSIFLVDKTCLRRHIAVRKNIGKTSIDYIDPNNPFREEVIFRALNTSIYEVIQPFNIIFEGGIDSDIFLATKHKFRKELPMLVSIGGIGATGAGEVKKYEKFFRGNLLVSAMVLFDSDDKGREEAARIKSDSLFDGAIFELKDIYNIGKDKFELEDILPKSVVLESARELYKYDFSSGINDKNPILDEIKKIKHEQEIEGDKKFKKLKEIIVKSVLKEIDPKVLSKEKFKLKYEHYYKFLEALEKKVSELKKT